MFVKEQKLDLRKLTVFLLVIHNIVYLYPNQIIQKHMHSITESKNAVLLNNAPHIKCYEPNSLKNTSDNTTRGGENDEYK